MRVRVRVRVRVRANPELTVTLTLIVTLTISRTRFSSKALMPSTCSMPTLAFCLGLELGLGLP